jgi:hypothetical protein
VTPQNDAGMRIDPPMSEPVASVAEPAASAAADPPLDPPGEYAVFHGLRVTPHSFVQVNGAQENSGVVGDYVSQWHRAERVALALDRRLLLHRHRQALQRSRFRAPARVPGLGLPGLVHRLLVAGLGEGVDGRLDRLGAGNYGRHQLGGGQLAGPEQAQRLGGGQVVQLGHAGGASSSAVVCLALAWASWRVGFQPGRGTLSRSSWV